MATQGWFNHYDEPDEFWDDEPLVPLKSTGSHPVSTSPANGSQHEFYREDPQLRTQPVDASRGPAGSGPQSRVGSSFASMDLDAGYLPVRIVLSPRWPTYVGPHEVGDELMAAYRASVSDRTRKLCSSGHWPTPQELSGDAAPDLRTIMMVLLEAETWEQYCSISSDMITSASYQVSSSASFQGGKPVTVTGDRAYMRSIDIWSDWAESVHPSQIVDEVMQCVDSIRRLRPKFSPDRDYSRYSDADLEYHLDRHRLRLLDERKR